MHLRSTGRRNGCSDSGNETIFHGLGPSTMTLEHFASSLCHHDLCTRRSRTMGTSSCVRADAIPFCTCMGVNQQHSLVPGPESIHPLPPTTSASHYRGVSGQNQNGEISIHTHPQTAPAPSHICPHSHVPHLHRIRVHPTHLQLPIYRYPQRLGPMVTHSHEHGRLALLGTSMPGLYHVWNLQFQQSCVEVIQQTVKPCKKRYSCR